MYNISDETCKLQQQINFIKNMILFIENEITTFENNELEIDSVNILKSLVTTKVLITERLKKEKIEYFKLLLSYYNQYLPVSKKAVENIDKVLKELNDPNISFNDIVSIDVNIINNF